MTLTLELYGGVKHVRRRSKQKGNAYELKIAKELSKWWGGKFSRVPASGGLHWGSDQRVAGDIIPPVNSNFPFVVECKKREDRKSTRLNSSHVSISYAVFCLNKKVERTI